MNTEGIGSVCVELGAGRLKKEDSIDHSAGIVLNKKTGDFCNVGETIATLFSSDERFFENAERIFIKSVEFDTKKPTLNNILLGIVE